MSFNWTEVDNCVQRFIEDVKKLGADVIGVNSEGTRLRILIDLYPGKTSEETKGGDVDDKKADTQR